MTLEPQESSKCLMPTGGVNTRNGIKKISSRASSSSSQEENNQQQLNETHDNSVGGAPDSRKSSKSAQGQAESTAEKQVAASAVGSARGSKKRKINEISNADPEGTSPSQSRRKLLKQSPSGNDEVGETKEEFVSLASVYLKPTTSSQDPLNMESLKQALPEAPSSSQVDQAANPVVADLAEIVCPIVIEEPEVAPLPVGETGSAPEEVVQADAVPSDQVDPQPLPSQAVDSPSVTDDCVAPADTEVLPQEEIKPAEADVPQP